jgi:hypothetical protein
LRDTDDNTCTRMSGRTIVRNRIEKFILVYAWESKENFRIIDLSKNKSAICTITKLCTDYMDNLYKEKHWTYSIKRCYIPQNWSDFTNELFICSIIYKLLYYRSFRKRQISELLHGWWLDKQLMEKENKPPFWYIFGMLFLRRCQYLDSVASNGSIMDEWQAENGFKENSLSVQEVLSLHISVGTDKSTRNLTQDSRYLDRHSNYDPLRIRPLSLH